MTMVAAHATPRAIRLAMSSGVLCYRQDARRSLPVHSFFVWNVNFTGPDAGVKRVLAALGIDSAPGPGDEDFR